MITPNNNINLYKNLVLVVSLIFFSAGSLFAQQDAQYTQYMYNTASVNPGYAGSRGHLSLALLHRSQWLGLDGAPVTQTFNAHSPVGYKGVGLGLSLLQDKIGPTVEQYADIDFSYTLQLSAEAKLSFGLKASAHLLDINFAELNQIAPDNTLLDGIDNKFSPNFGAGVYYHTEKFYAGLSVPRFLETTHFKSGAAPSTAAERMNFYLITGYVWDLNPFLKFKPALLAKAVQGAPLQVDVSANFMLNEKFVLGAAYRWDAAFSGMAGFHIFEGFFLGLAYDREITELGNAAFNNGSYEAIIRYDFIKTKGYLKSPRFF